MIDGYYYLHENKSLVFKHKGYPIEDMRDSDLVKAIWTVDGSDRCNAWGILVEASCLGADKNRIKELADKWSCDNEDGKIYCKHIGVKLSLDGDSYCATKKDFTNLQECPAGFGENVIDALSDLCKELGYRHSKLNWHKKFTELVK